MCAIGWQWVEDICMISLAIPLRIKHKIQYSDGGNSFHFSRFCKTECGVESELSVKIFPYPFSARACVVIRDITTLNSDGINVVIGSAELRVVKYFLIANPQSSILKVTRCLMVTRWYFIPILFTFFCSDFS